MNKAWPKVRLGEVLRLDLDIVPVDAAATYPMVGVLSFGRGLFDREPIENGKTSYRYFYRLNRKHVVMSQLFGWEGALALSSEQYAGKYLSPQFPTFLCDATKLDRRYLGWVMRLPSFWEDLGTRATGMGDRRRTLNPTALFACEIPLPTFPEQRRIVARIEQLDAKIGEARKLRRQAAEESEHTLISIAHRDDLPCNVKKSQGWVEVALGDVITQVEDKQRVVPDKYYPNIGMYSFGRGLFIKPPIQGFQSSATSLNQVCAGQFIYSRLFAFEGAYGIVTDEFDQHFVSNEYPTFTCNVAKLLPEFLYAYFKRPRVWSQVAAGSKGLGDRRQRVQPTQLLSYRVMLPPLKNQIELREIVRQVDSLKRLQADTAAELDALLPSVLDKAFKGEL